MSSSSYATALDEELEPPTTHEESIQHEGKTLQQMINEGTGSSQQNPIDIDQFDEGPGPSQYNPIDVDHPHTDVTNFVCSHDGQTTHWPKLWGEINDG